ncbi:MAG: YetF domain-containing protein [Chitinophagaceae bacterium]
MRTFGLQTPFDMVVYITLGGMLDRTIMGHYPFLPCLAACAGLVLLHRLFAVLSFHSKFIHKLTTGNPVLLFSEGKEKPEKMQKHEISRKDLMVTIRENGFDNLDGIQSIWLEPDGTLA